MYVYYDTDKNRIIKISQDKCSYKSQTIKEFQLDTNESMLFYFEIDVDLNNNQVSLKPISEIKSYMIKLFESLIEKTIVNNFNDWGANYSEIIQEVQSTGLYLETKILYVLTNYIQIDLCKLRKDAYGLLNNIMNINKRIITKSDIESVVDDFVENTWIQSGVDSSYKDFLIKNLMKYIDVILILNLSEELWDYEESFENEIKNIVSYTDLNTTYIKYLNLLNESIFRAIKINID